MSAKQSKIFNFFQRKPSLTNNGSPSVSKPNSFNGDETPPINMKLSASGDSSLSTKFEAPAMAKYANLSLQKKRSIGELELKESFQDDFADPDELDKVCNKAEKCIQQDVVDDVQESRPPTKKRKRIVSSHDKYSLIYAYFNTY